MFSGWFSIDIPLSDQVSVFDSPQEPAQPILFFGMLFILLSFIRLHQEQLLGQITLCCII
jgi:hypothetical protein